MKRLVRSCLFLFFLFSFLQKGLGSGVKEPHSHTDIRFTENLGQWDPKVLFQAQLDGGVLFLENNCFTYNFYDKETLRRNHISQKAVSSDLIRTHAFRMSFSGAEPKPFTESKKPTHDYNNYYFGNDPDKWKSGVRNYSEVYYDNLYPAIDLQVLGMQNSIKYNFIVAQGGNTSDIALLYEGTDEINLENKSLRIKTSLNELIEEKPYAYQLIDGKRTEVPCEFVLKNNVVSFRFPKGYDKALALVIDPILVFACSSGSTADNFGMTATYDADGNLYGGGTCFAAGYPTTLGAYDPSYNGIVAYGRTDVVITKYDSSGTFLQYSTYLGGSLGTEVVTSLIVTPTNELMLFGATGSADFPVTPGAYDITFGGGDSLFFPANGTKYEAGTDLYAAKFNNTGTSLLACTYIGGSENEGTNSSSTVVYNYGDYYRGEIQTDYSGNCYIGSCTFSADFPVTPGCFQSTLGGGMDGVVFKLNPTFSTLIWSTYLGGINDDVCFAITVDPARDVFITGGTSSPNFPSTPGVISPVYNGGVADGYITKLKNDGSAVLRSTFIGTPAYDMSFLVQLDNNQDVYVVGQSLGTMPVSLGVYSDPNSQQFIWQLDNTLSTAIFTTNIGNGTNVINISPSAFLVDTCGNIYVCGWGGNILTGTPTTGMPITPGAYQTTTDGFNFYLMVLGPDALSLMYATYFGGAQSWEHVDGGTSRFDKRGIVYHAVCAGCGGHDDFPVTPGSWPYSSPSYSSSTGINMSTNCNMGVFKFDFQQTGPNANAVVDPNDTICVGGTVDFNNASTSAYNYEWNFGDGSPPSSAASPSHTFNSAGTFDIQLIAFDSSGCIFSDTTYLSVVVIPVPVVDLGNDTAFCHSPSLLLDAGNPGCFYTWSTGANTQTITATDSVMYWVTVSNGICASGDSIQISEFIRPEIGPDTILCTGQAILLDATSTGASYLWSTGANTPTIGLASSGQYWVQLDWGTCQLSDTMNLTFNAYPSVSLQQGIVICPGNSAILDAGSPATAYNWSTGETTQSIEVGGGDFFVTVYNGPCATSDSTHVTAVPPIGWSEEAGICNLDKYTLDPGIAAGTYLWSTGETTPTIDVTEAGEYWALINNQGCILSDTITVYGALGSGILWFPNSFTPNHNGLNDVFMPKGRDITEYHLMIFDRWGELLFETSRTDEGWDGSYQGRLCEQDVYVWKVQYKTKCDPVNAQKNIGHVVLVR